MGGAPIIIIVVVLGVITAMGVFFDFLSKAAARAAKEARERAQQERAARASGQPPPPPRRQDAPPAIVELERYLRNLVEPDGQQGQGGQVFAPVPREQAPRQVPVARVVRAQPAPPARSARRIDAEQQSGHLEDHHLGTTIEGRRFEGEVERRHVVPTGGTLEGHHLQTQLSQVAGAQPAAGRAQAPRGLAMIDRLPPMARAMAYAELFGPPPGLGRGPKGPRRRFTRAVDA